MSSILLRLFSVYLATPWSRQGRLLIIRKHYLGVYLYVYMQQQN